MSSFEWPPTGGSGGVTSINTLTGDIILAAGTGLTLSTTGNTITFNVTPQVVGNLTDVGTDGIVITGGTGAVFGSGTSIAQHVADTTHNGYLSSTDWNAFNGKQSALTLGNLTESGSANLTVTGGTGAVVGSGVLLTLTGASIVEATSSVLTLTGATNAVLGTGVSIQVKQASTSQSGYLSNTDWNTFNGKGSGSVTSVAFTGDGTVLSSTPSTAVTTSGTLPATLKTQTARTFLQGPFSGSAAAPTFAALTLPTVSTAKNSGTSTGTGQFISGTYTTPTGVLYLLLRAVGGGGGGGGTGTGGVNAGGNGGDTTFSGTNVSITAGHGVGAGVNGGTGGTATVTGSAVTTMIAMAGGVGQGGQSGTASIYLSGGSGASTPFGSGGGGGSGNGAGSAAASNSGAGGGGGGTNTATVISGAGGGGSAAYIEVLITPTAGQTFSYSVGAAGTAGSAGTSGQAGALGGLGQIIVEEYYQ